MSIDWITVSAQIVNFLILVWLLKRLLYKPVIAAMEQREASLHQRIEQARQREREADALAKSCEQRQTALERDREQLLADARTEVEAQRKDWLAQARSETDRQREQWSQQVESEKQAFLEDLEQQASETLRHLASDALAGLADQSLEERLLDQFLHRLSKLPPEQRDALSNADGAIHIRTAFALDPAVRSRMTRQVHADIDADAQLDYQEDDTLVCGVELTRGGFRLAWNLADYLQDVRERLASGFESPVEPER